MKVRLRSLKRNQGLMAYRSWLPYTFQHWFDLTLILCWQLWIWRRRGPRLIGGLLRLRFATESMQFTLKPRRSACRLASRTCREDDGVDRRGVITEPQVIDRASRRREREGRADESFGDQGRFGEGCVDGNGVDEIESGTREGAARGLGTGRDEPDRLRS